MGNWITSEAGVTSVALIFTIIGGSISFLISWSQRRKPTKLVILETETIRLLDIHPSQKERIFVGFKDDREIVPIVNLIQKKMVIYNAGSEDIIEPVSFHLPVMDESRECPSGFVKAICEQPECEISVRREKDDGDVSYVRGLDFVIKHLNSRQLHPHFIKVFVFAEQEIVFPASPVVGRGWSTKVLDKRRIDRAIPIIDNLFLFLFLVYVISCGFLILFLMGLILSALDIKTSDMTDIVEGVYAVFLLVIWGIGLFRAILPIMRRELQVKNFIANRIVLPLFGLPPLSELDSVKLSAKLT